MGVGYGFFFVDDGVGGIEAVGGVVVVAGSEVVEVGGLFAFFVGELGFGGVVDGLTGLDFFAEGAVGGGIDDIAGIVGDNAGGIDLVCGVVEVFVGHGSVFSDQSATSQTTGGGLGNTSGGGAGVGCRLFDDGRGVDASDK